MRELKFRAWQGFSMSSPFFLMDVTNKHSTFFDGECKVMQYTGLKDKNGTDIYEGDILKMPGVGKCIVEYSDRDAAYVFVNDSDEYQYQEIIEDFGCCNIIGNIYESPEKMWRFGSANT